MSSGQDPERQELEQRVSEAEEAATPVIVEQFTQQQMHGEAPSLTQEQRSVVVKLYEAKRDLADYDARNAGSEQEREARERQSRPPAG